MSTIITNFDAELVKAKLNKLDDIGDRISSLYRLLNSDKLQSIVPDDFYRKALVSETGKGLNDVKKQYLKNKMNSDNGINNIQLVDGNFSHRAEEIVNHIKILRDSIENADRNTKSDGIIPRKQVRSVAGVEPTSYGDGADANKYQLENNLSFMLPDGSSLSLGSGEYGIVDRINDENGKTIAIAIEKDGKKIWIYFDANGTVEKYVIEPNNMMYNLLNSITCFLVSGETKEVPSGSYQVVQAIYDNTGQLKQIIILVDGTKICLEVRDGIVVSASQVTAGEFEIKNSISLSLMNGKVLDIKAGKYAIIDKIVNTSGETIAVCIQIENYKIWLELSSDGSISKYRVIINGETYFLDNSIEYIDADGKTVTVNSGVYTLLEEIYDSNGNLLQIIILVNGKRIALEIRNGTVVSAIQVDDSYFELKQSMALVLPNGVTINLEAGSYRIIDVLYENGNLVAVCIEVDSHRVWLNLNANVEVASVRVIVNGGYYTLNNNFEFVDESGNYISIVSGNYPLLEVIFDTNGIVKQVVILVDGKRLTINIENGEAVGILNITPATYHINSTIYAYALDGSLVEIIPGEYNILRYLYDKDGNIIAIVIQVGDKEVTLRYHNGHEVGLSVKPTTYSLKYPYTFVLPNGQKQTLNPGEYDIIDVLFDENGNVTAVCIKFENYKLWLYLDSIGNVTRVEVLSITPGIFTITSPDLVVKDKFGNILPNINPGDYQVYEVKYDQDGNAIAVRISPDGEDEVWVYLNPDSENDKLVFFDKNLQGKNGGILSLFKSKNALLGVLGVLFVSAGTYLAVKKRKRKEENYGEEYDGEYFEEDDSYSDYNIEDSSESTDEEKKKKWEYGDPISSGNYGVYEVEEDIDNNIISARISPDDASEEYWVEV